ncbi:hypothetical protein CsatA_015369 [Cannabis sativa]
MSLKTPFLNSKHLRHLELSDLLATKLTLNPVCFGCCVNFNFINPNSMAYDKQNLKNEIDILYLKSLLFFETLKNTALLKWNISLRCWRKIPSTIRLRFKTKRVLVSILYFCSMPIFYVSFAEIKLNTLS